MQLLAKEVKLVSSVDYRRKSLWRPFQLKNVEPYGEIGKIDSARRCRFIPFSPYKNNRTLIFNLIEMLPK